jgi:DNA-binding NarL/FixJ family response regulator
MLRQLGPEPTSVESAIGKLLDRAVAKLREEAGAAESAQIDLICNALAVLRPLIPISMLAQLSQTSEGAVRSFALELGRGILVKENSLHFLDEPTETWFHENFQPDEEALNRFINHLQPPAPQNDRKNTNLSPREFEVLQLMVEGKTNVEIAEELYLSPNTIKTHVRGIMNKLSVDDRVQAAVTALRSGLVS